MLFFGRYWYSVNEPFLAGFHFGVYGHLGLVDLSSTHLPFPLVRLVSAVTLYVSSHPPSNWLCHSSLQICSSSHHVRSRLNIYLPVHAYDWTIGFLAPLEPGVNTPFPPKPTKILKTSWAVSIHDMASIYSIWCASLAADLEKSEDKIPLCLYGTCFIDHDHISSSPRRSDAAHPTDFFFRFILALSDWLSWVHTAPPVINVIASNAAVTHNQASHRSGHGSGSPAFS